jgi:hypothetical protein
MENLYSYKGSYPYPLPKDIYNYDINDFVLAPEKPTLSKGEILEWGGTNWVVRTPNDAELDIKWQEIRDTRNILLSKTDIKILKYLERKLDIPEELLSYREQLRDLPQQQENPFNIIWPVDPNT